MKSGKVPDFVTDHEVAKYRLSKAAEADLMGIALFGEENFGVARSDRYRDQLKQRFLTLAEHPLRYPTVNHIRKGYRRSVCGVHSIFYRVDDSVVEIMRILKNQYPGKQLFSHQ